MKTKFSKTLQSLVNSADTQSPSTLTVCVPASKHYHNEYKQWHHNLHVLNFLA